MSSLSVQHRAHTASGTEFMLSKRVAAAPPCRLPTPFVKDLGMRQRTTTVTGTLEADRSLGMVTPWRDKPDVKMVDPKYWVGVLVSWPLRWEDWIRFQTT